MAGRSPAVVLFLFSIAAVAQAPQQRKIAEIVRTSTAPVLDGNLDDPVWADATIDGEVVVVTSSQVPYPVAVRYAWADNPKCNLFNKEGLPAAPFRTDQWPGVTVDKK